MPHDTDRILTTHVGSLIRPPKLIEFWRAIEDDKPYDEAAFEACLTQFVAEVVRQQAEAGIDIVSDGEFSKGANWAFYIFKGSTALPCHRPLRETPNTRWPPCRAAATATHFRNFMPSMTPHPAWANGWATGWSSTGRSNIRSSRSPATL